MKKILFILLVFILSLPCYAQNDEFEGWQGSIRANFQGVWTVSGTTVYYTTGYVGVGRVPIVYFDIYHGSPSANQTLFLIATNAGNRFAIDEDGDHTVYGGWTQQNPAPLSVWRNTTHEDGDGLRETIFNYIGEQSGGESSTLARVMVGHDGAADDQKGEYTIFVNDGDDGTSPTQRVFVDSDGAMKVTGSVTPFLSDTVASATNITFGKFNNFVVTGTTQIDSFDVASTLLDWTEITIEFTGSCQMTDGANLKLSGNFSGTTDDLLTLQRRGDFLLQKSGSNN